ncbi:GTPase [Okeania sp. SIO2B3]|uniref:GTPase n=1 Tax=Okeania sp. SIO2B3 TaxID=2607784 RepID=UPI0013C02CEC|nr:GTPase domain-containing protein [Okeania sp. SIO2B3]NET42879.1 GTPase domain-containing protein [Okeania sp. SIO2B3]
MKFKFEEEKLGKEYQKARQLIGKSSKSKCNLLITGRTGVGKSTLINAIFKDKFAKTGVGEPVTQDIKPYEIPANNFRIYDIPGLEIKDIKKFKQKVFQKIKEQRKRKLEEHIHCIWYCINEGTGRLEAEE